jgi:transposase
MKAYSQDLRERIADALAAGEVSQRAIAERFGVSKRFVERLSSRLHQTGSCAALPHAGGRARTLAPLETWLRAEVARQPDVSLEELCDRVQHAHGLQVNASMMCRELQRLDLPRKKVAPRQPAGNAPGEARAARLSEADGGRSPAAAQVL